MRDLVADEFQDLLRTAEEAVDHAFDAEHRVDPMLGRMSRAVSIAGSLTKRHGHLLEDAVAIALRQSGKYEVCQQVRFPITEAAERLVAANRPESLRGIRLSFDAEARRAFDLDIAAVDVEGSRAIAVDIKRSVGTMGGGRRAALERELQAIHLLLRSFFRQQGIPVDDVAVAIIDLQEDGSSTSPLVLGKGKVDAFFQVPVISWTDHLTRCMRDRIALRSSELMEFGKRGLPGRSPTQGASEPVPELDVETPVASIRSDWRGAYSRTGGAASPKRRNARPTRSGSRRAPMPSSLFQHQD